MKKLSLIAALALAGFSMSSQAATVGQTFNVTATLVSVCLTNNATPTDVNFGAYTAFGSAAIPAPTTTISFKCTRGVTPTGVALDTTTGSIKGVNYSLAIGAVTTVAGVAPAATTHSYVVTGTMAAGQPGDTAGAAGPIVHTLTITY